MEARHEGRLTLALGGACLLLLAAGWWPRLTVRRAQAPAPSEPHLTVSIAGAVRAPGTYRLPWGARVEGLVDAAGGLTRDADPTLLAPADPLSDGEAVVVPTVRTAAGDVRISINRADPEALEDLPGIGPALAARIVAGRPYRRVDDLEGVSGIGPATMERLRPLVAP